MAQNIQKFATILFPADLTEQSDKVAEYALMLARQNRAALTVLHVVDMSHEAAGFYIPHLSFDKIEKELISAAEAIMRKYITKNFRGYKKIEAKVVTGEPYSAILKAIKTGSPDLVLMGSSGRKGVDKFFFGSTADRVIKKSNCPILIIPSI